MHKSLSFAVLGVLAIGVSPLWAQGVDVNVDRGGATVDAPGASVDAGRGGASVRTPGAAVDAGRGGANVETRGGADLGRLDAS